MKKFFKRLIKKVNGGGLLYLSLLTAFTVGYSSWAIIQSNNINLDINAQFGEVVQGNIFSLKNTKGFIICKDGFIRDETIFDSDTLEFTININTKSAKDGGFLDQNNQLKIDLSLSCKDSTTIFSNIDYISGVTLASGSANQTLNYSSVNNSIISNANVLTNGIDSIDIIIKYNFKGNCYTSFNTAKPAFFIEINAIRGVN